MRVNQKDIQQGAVLYLYLADFLRDGSGLCELKACADPDMAARWTPLDKIYKVTLEEVPIEEFEETEVVKKRSKRVKR